MPSVLSRSLRLIVLVVCSCTAVNAQDNPPRIEIGAVLSATRQPDIDNYFHVGGGGRVTVNVTRYIAGEVESTLQPTNEAGLPTEVHTALAVKGTYRAEQRRWLRFAGLNFFGVLGPAWVNRSVLLCIGACGYVLQRQTASMLEYGGGFEIVPARRVAVRFDVTHASFNGVPAGASMQLNESWTYFKTAVMLRVP